MRTITGYADGACEPVNPGGTASYGVVLYEHGREIRSTCGIVARGKDATNNVAEFAAAGQAFLEALNLRLGHGDRLILRGDSKLWVEILNGRWKVRTPNAPYIPYLEAARDRLRALRVAGVQVDIQWVPREQNTRADDLSKLALANIGVGVQTH
jgi:ribonuclease HI